MCQRRSLLIPHFAVQHLVFGLLPCEAKQHIVYVIPIWQSTSLHTHTQTVDTSATVGGVTLLRSNPICYAAGTSDISTLRLGVALCYSPQPVTIGYSMQCQMNSALYSYSMHCHSSVSTAPGGSPVMISTISALGIG